MAVGMSNDTETPATVEPRQNGHAQPSERRSPSEPAKGQSISDQQSPAPQTGPHIQTGAVSGEGQNGNSTGDASTTVAASDSCKNSVTPLAPPIVTDTPSPPVAPPESAAAAGGGSDTTEPPDAKRPRTDSTAGSPSVSAASSPAAGQQSSGPPALDTAGQRTLELIESSLLKLKREVKALDLLTRQKEREWDGLLKLRKAKEETFQRLRRKRQVLLIQHNEPVTAPAAPPRVSQAAAAVGSGMGPQGPTVSVRQLIESHRAASQPLPVPSYAESLLRRQQQQQQLPQMSPAADPHYREMLAQIAKLNKQAAAAAAAAVTGCSTPEVSIQQVPMSNSSSSATAGQSSHHSSLAKLLMESKRKQGDAVLSEMLKQPHMSVSAAVAAMPRAPIISPMVQPRPSAPVPPPPAPVEDVPLCQGCRSRQAQFVCAGCGNQWYCSRECQVDSWDSHADECTG